MARLLVISFALVTVSLTTAASHGALFAWTPLSLALMTAGDLFLLPIVLGLVYVHARPVFLDVVLKRGALNLGLTVVTLERQLNLCAGTSATASSLARCEFLPQAVRSFIRTSQRVTPRSSARAAVELPH
jgi:hypothetical protein